jgi:putative hemolysin
LSAALFATLPAVAAMLGLLALSAFFSSSEAALYSLGRSDRKTFETGSRGQRAAARLLSDPDRLLSAILFWNLLINLILFSISSSVVLNLEKVDHPQADLWSYGFATASVFVVIIFAELLPKSLGVLLSSTHSALVAIPLSFAVRVVDPIMPVLRGANLISRRLVWPGFHPEPYLEVSDLERAIDASSADEELVEHERRTLQQLVSLSTIRCDEWMRPRGSLEVFRAPIHLSDLKGELPKNGYLLLLDPEEEEITSWVAVKDFVRVPQKNLEHHAEPVIYVPWSATLASVFQEMQTKDREVAVVVNEYGESIGMLTIDDMLDTVLLDPEKHTELADAPGLSGSRLPIIETEPGVYRAVGTLSLRRAAVTLKIDTEEGDPLTIVGILQLCLGRLPTEGDECQWRNFDLRVLRAPARGAPIVEIRRQAEETDE